LLSAGYHAGNPRRAEVDQKPQWRSPHLPATAVTLSSPGGVCLDCEADRSEIIQESDTTYCVLL
jgi:hypothetical protein